MIKGGGNLKKVVYRMADNRLVKRAKEDRRKRGRPAMKWIDSGCVSYKHDGQEGEIFW